MSNGVNLPRTAFSDFSDKDLYRCYTSDVWDRLSPDAKQHLLQETANRETIAYGDKYAVNLQVKDLPEGVYGVQNGRNVAASTQLVNDGKVSVTYNGKTAEYNVPASNWQSLETVLHEVRHTWQDEVSAGRIQAENGLKESFEANNYTVSDVDGKLGIQYMKGVTDERLYLLNPTEADSNRYAQSKTAQIIESLRNEGIVDKTMEEYEQNIQLYGYEANLDAMKTRLGENVDKEVEQTLKNIHNNTNVPVDKNIEQAVKNEMTASYNKMLEEMAQNHNLQNNAETASNTLAAADNNLSADNAATPAVATPSVGDNTSPDEADATSVTEDASATAVHDNDAEDFDGETPAIDISDDGGILDNDVEGFSGDAPALDMTDDGGIIDNDVEDFDGEAPSLEIGEKESDFRDEEEDASASVDAEDSLSDDDGLGGGDDGLGDD